MVSSAENRHNFIQSAIQFIKRYHFDGIEIHWKYPGVYNFYLNND